MWFTTPAYKLLTKKKCYYKCFKKRRKSNLYSHDLFWLHFQQPFLTVLLTAFQITHLESKNQHVSSSASGSNDSQLFFELQPTNHFEHLLNFKCVHSPSAISTAIFMLSLKQLWDCIEDLTTTGAALCWSICWQQNLAPPYKSSLTLTSYWVTFLIVSKQ